MALIGNRLLTAESFQALSDKALKTVGISARKIAYLRDLADKVISDRIDFRRLGRLSDDEVIRRITCVKGIGRWTAEMYLIFVLCRPDVLPLDDSALRSAIRAIGLWQVGDSDESVHTIAESWRPFRSIACWYLWTAKNQKLDLV